MAQRILHASQGSMTGIRGTVSWESLVLGSKHCMALLAGQVVQAKQTL